MFKIKHPERGTIVVDETPLYGIERQMGVDPALPRSPEGTEMVEFRLYDDDDNFVYGGVLDDDDEGENQLAALRYGEADEGATRIEVKRGEMFVQEVA